MKKLFPQNIKNIYHLCQAILVNLVFGFPSRKIRIIGVTGTNGKTTVCQMITKIMEEAGCNVAMISTINFKIGKKEWVNATKFTTLSSFKIQRFVRQAVRAHCQYLILETSSHSLDQRRVWGIQYDTAVITNITREHLDYHKTMKEYREAKLKLFRDVKTAVINLDMEKPNDFLQCGAENKYGYTKKFPISNFQFPNKSQFSNFKIIASRNIELSAQYTRYNIQDINFKLRLPGLFNTENALAATCVGLAYNIDLETIKKALEKIEGIPGRMEKIPNSKRIEIIIDYAVTPDSLEKSYSLIQNIRSNSQKFAPDSRIISVFGACGERDRGKRPIMGEIVDKYADFIILTNEDPYGEDPIDIVNELESGIKKHELEKDYWKILNRREAIKKALQTAKPGDIVVVTGKGAEETMVIGRQRIPWNDKKVILEELAALS